MSVHSVWPLAAVTVSRLSWLLVQIGRVSP
jgi:hypothetical protein